MTYPDLFASSDKSFGTPAQHLVRRDAIDTSIEAAQKLDTSKLEEMVFEQIKKSGEHGCISDDVLAAFPQLPYSSVTARYRSLLDKQYIEDTGERRPGNSGRSQRVMRAVR